MKVFLDANVLISVLNKEYSVFTYSSKILSLVDSKKYKIYTSPLCLAIAFYFAEKKHGTISTRNRINILVDKIGIAGITAEAVKLTTANKKVHDFEDGLEYYAALEAGCKIIITENVKDFYFSSIEVITCRQFLEKYF